MLDRRHTSRNLGASPTQSLEAARQLSPRLVRIHLLGSMRAVTVFGHNVLPRGRRARAVLGIVCLSAEPISRTKLCAILWDRVTEHQGRASLRQALSELKAAFGQIADDLLKIDRERDTISLDSSNCWVDAVALLSDDPVFSIYPRAALAAICSGELLSNLDGITSAFDDWVFIERGRFKAALSSLIDSEPDTRGETLSSRVRDANRAYLSESNFVTDRAIMVRYGNGIDGAIRRIIDAETSSFGTLAHMSGLDPSVDFRFTNLSGVDFSGEDLTGFDFTGALLQGAKFRGARIVGAIFDSSRPVQRLLRAALDAKEYFSSKQSKSQGKARGQMRAKSSGARGLQRGERR